MVSASTRPLALFSRKMNSDACLLYSEFIFRENNANGRVEADTIDLHGQFVEEAEEILEDDTIARNDIRRV
jgi:hypothetical protein